MADLTAIGYPDEATALSAMDEGERLQHDLARLFFVPKSAVNKEFEAQQELQEALHGEGSTR